MYRSSTGQMAALLSSCCPMPTTSQAAPKRIWSPMTWLDTWQRGADSHCCMAQVPGPYTSGGCRTPGHNPVGLLAAGGRRTPTQGHTQKNRGRARDPGAVSRYIDPQVWVSPPSPSPQPSNICLRNLQTHSISAASDPHPAPLLSPSWPRP